MLLAHRRSQKPALGMHRHRCVQWSTKVRPILLKNESERFGLGAFKALGGVYAVGQLIAEAFTSVHKRTPEIDEFMSDEFKKLAASQSFVCASAGNHGMAVAAGARLFGSKARIYLSEEVPSDFAGRLRALGAEVVIAGANYEASLVAAQNDARDTTSTLLADGCFPEREHPPALVMEGYTVMGTELGNYFKKQGVWPSDVYLQAGVCLLYTSPSPRDKRQSRMPSSA